VLVDTYTDNSGNLRYGYVGFRAYNGSDGTDEVAMYDNIVLTNYLPNASTGVIEPVVAFSENFETGSNPFDGADTVRVSGNNKLKMVAKASDLRVLQGGAGIPMFRTKFTLDQSVKSAKIYTSALGVYDLFINGSRVGTPTWDGKIVYDELKPGWTEYSKTVQYSTYDVTALLHSGANAIGAQVASGWWNGGIAHGQYGNLDLSFIAKLVIEYTDGSTKTVVSDPTWLSTTTGPVRMADIYNGETYDARNESNWAAANYDDFQWFQTAVFNGFNGQVKAFVGPTIQVRPEMAIQPAKITVYEGSKANGQTYGAINTVSTLTGAGAIQLKKGQTAIYDFGQNMAGWVKFTAKAAAGTKIKLRFGEMLNDNGASSRGNDGPANSLYTANFRSAKATLNYIFKGGESAETFNPNLTFFGFRYCEVSANQDVDIQSITAEVVGSATEEGSTLKTSSSLINKLYSNVIWGQRSNFLSVTTDCPQRDERLGWTGDTQIFSRAASYNADVAAFFHKWMGDMRDSQRGDGAFPSTAPIIWGGYGQGAWAEAGIIVPWNVYLMYDDAGIIAENYVAMEKYMAFLAAQSGGGFLYNGAGTDFGDWVAYEAMDNRYISVCYYAYAAQLMSKMSKALSQTTGDSYDVKSANYANLYNKIKTEFQARYVNSNGTLKQVSQTAYLLALKLGLFPNDAAKNTGITYLTQKIANNGNKLSTGFIGTGILNQTLSQFGATNTAYNLLLQRGNPSWLYSIDQGATTIWERWDSYTIEKGFQTVDMNSFNHYSYGAVSEWMYRFMAGIEADESAPGFKHFILQPNPDKRTTLPQGQERITSVEAKYKSYYGDIKSAWVMRTDGNLSYTATVPANTTATLYLSLAASTDVVYEGSVLAENAEGVTFVKKEDGKAVYELKSGTYSFGLNVPVQTATKDVLKKKVNIYPNPVHDRLTVAAEPTDYLISDMDGKKVLAGKGTTVNVSEIVPGIYFIRVGNMVSKFIKS
jgi:alpha-L-rhamnosidase